MKTTHALIPAVAIAAACAAPLPPASSTGSAPARKDSVRMDRAAQERAGIVVEPAREITRVDRFTAPGVIAIDETRTARVGSLQEGLVLAVHVEVGSRVARNQLLATMHGHAVHDGLAGYRKALADRRRAETELAYATDARARAERLYASKAISLQERQRTEVDQVAARERLAMAEAEVRRAIEELEHIGIAVTPSLSGENVPAANEPMPVRSPIAGVVLERLVTPGTTVVPGTPMFVVSELSSVWAVVELDESHLPRLRVGRPVEVRVAAYPDEAFAGTITYVADMVNPKTRRITVRATVPNADGRLKPEMFASVVIPESEARTVVTVPRDAVQKLGEDDVVFVADGDGSFVPRQVVVGADGEGGLEIVSGLAAGERIVAHGSFVLKSELLESAGESGN